jgi:predicted molibdopterin-dependent oxidoreductase YjgC
MTEIIIDGKNCEVQPEETILEVAGRNGIRIPTLCYHKKLSPIGSCRVCMVEIEGAQKPMAACTTEALDSMVVRTNTERVRELRRTAIKLMLINHKLDCHVCDASGACALQDLAYEYNVESHDFGEISVERDVGLFSSPLINYDPQRCIMCLRCIHACSEIRGVKGLSIGLRGSLAHVESDSEKCLSCGECLHVCPVGALTQKLTRPPERIHQMEKVQTTCPYCGSGCQMELRVSGDKVWGITTDDDLGPNYGSLCVKGRFGFDFIHHSDRLTTPLIKKKGKFEEASWDEALDLVADKLKEIKDEHGSDSFLTASSAKATNEENFALMKFTRAVLGTNNIDHCARL